MAELNFDEIDKQPSIDREYLYSILTELFPYNRSITGEGVRKTFDILKRELDLLTTTEISSGTKCFDWTVPQEWRANEAYIIGPDGSKIVDFKVHNLHLVGYSTKVDEIITLDELQGHLHSLPDQPNAIPYITSYYKKYWGFCLTDNQRKSLKDGNYHVYIDSEHFDGSLTYGEIILPGKIKKEVFFSTYICHPSMANNELSGPVVILALAKWLNCIEDRKYTYRFIFIPETIGSIAYLSKNINHMKKDILFGYNVSCVGDDNNFSFIPSREENTISDRVLKNILQYETDGFNEYSYLDRGSDERQYCSPGVDLPIATFCRTKFFEYPEYHTSLDDLSYISANGLATSLLLLKKVIFSLENNCNVIATNKCEPHLSKYNLYPTISTKSSNESVIDILNFLSYSDGRSILDIAEKIKLSIIECIDIFRTLKENDLVNKAK